MTNSALTLKKLESGKRGHADHDWLKTYHHFSFADYYNAEYSGFGALRVINEDRVAPQTGFPKHSHREYEIFSYIVSGELTHNDSMGNQEVMKRGEIQMTSGGTGISHSEFNKHPTKDAAFLQIWAKPNQAGLTPKYYGRHFSDEEKRASIVKVVGPIGDNDVIDERNGDGPVPVHADIRVYAAILAKGQSKTHSLHADTTKAIIHNIMTSGYRKPAALPPVNGTQLHVTAASNTVELNEGDSVFVEVGQGKHDIEIQSTGQNESEFLIFEMM